MARINKANNNTRDGSIGSITYQNIGDLTIAKVKVNKYGEKHRTVERMVERARFGAVSLAYNPFKWAVQNCFEIVKVGQNEQNLFVKYNNKDSMVYLTKKQQEAKSQILQPFWVSKGSLNPSIEVFDIGDYLVSDISLGKLVIGELTTAWDFYTALIANNGYRFDDGDCLRFIVAEQQRANQYSAPKIQVASTQIELLARGYNNHNTPLFIGVDERFRFTSVGMRLGEEVTNFVAFKKRSDTMVGWVQMRKDKKQQGIYYTTSQRLMGSNELLDQYSSFEAMQEAINSYSKVKPSFFSAKQIYEMRYGMKVTTLQQLLKDGAVLECEG